MNEEELKQRHKELMKADLGKAMLDNPDLIWNTSDFISKISKRCRRCYAKLMNDIVNNVDTSTAEYYEKNMCSSCLALYKAKLERLKQ